LASSSNRQASCGKQRVRLIDATLREGNQAPGVQLTPAQSTHIAALLARLGVDMIECGHPAISPDEMERVRQVAQLDLPCPILAHARARHDDVAAASECGASWVGIFLGINEITRRTRLSNRSTDELLSLIANSVTYARRCGLQVRYTVEDASRTDLSLIVKAFRVAQEAGANRLCFADTVGILEPGEVTTQIKALKQLFPEIDLEVHLHDDRGLALANTLAAIDAGADWISTSVNGLGERAGITDLCLLLANLHHRNDRPLMHGKEVQALSQLVAAYSRSQVDSRRPVVGRNAFTHSADLHVKAVRRDPMAYTWIDTELLGASLTEKPPGLPQNLEGLVIVPKVIDAAELRYHTTGPGVRHVMLDERAVPDCRVYCIVRELFPLTTIPEAHVDIHRHKVDSLYLFLGRERGLGGLRVEVQLGHEVKEIDSPACLFIPSGVDHSYRVIGGEGLYINFVLAGSYNDSLLEIP
jgi:2-isopropylmalate synthase